jgi:hypothetical protein
MDSSLLLRDPVVIRDRKSRGKVSKTGRILSAFEHVDLTSTIMTTPRRKTTATPGQRIPSLPRKQTLTLIPYWRYNKNSMGQPAPTAKEVLYITEARTGQPRDEFGFRIASNHLDLEGRCMISDDPIALHDEHGWTHITACGNAHADPFDDEVYPEYEEELYTYFGDVLMTPTEKALQTEMLQQWSECEAKPRYIYTWKRRSRPQPQVDTVVDSIEQEIEQAIPTPQMLKSALKRRREDTEQEEVDSEVPETQGAYRGTRSRLRSVTPLRKRVRFSEV